MGNDFLNRLAGEQEGKIFPATQMLSQVAVEWATGLGALTGGVGRDGVVQIRQVDDATEVGTGRVHCAEASRSLNGSQVEVGNEHMW